MKLITINPAHDPRWQQLVDRYPSSVFHSPAWLRVLESCYDFTVRAHILQDATGTPHAGLPFVRVADMLGERTVSLPFSDYCDPLVSDADQAQRLLDQLTSQRDHLKMRTLHNPLPLSDGRLNVVKKAKWHGVDLRPALDDLWSNLHPASRRAIRKAAREGVSVRAARADELRTFFELHLGVRKYKYRLLSQPYAFFEQIWHQLIDQQKGVLLLAWYQDQVIAGTLLLEWQNTLYYKFNASRPEHLSLGPNDLLVWEGISYAKERGLTSFDFGLSDWAQEGLLRFKRKFASEEKTIHFLEHHPNPNPTPQEQQARRLLPRLTELFTRDTVADAVTEQAGETLYRHFV